MDFALSPTSEALREQLLEFMDETSCPRPLQIFGSDISEQAVQTARQKCRVYRIYQPELI